MGALLQAELIKLRTTRTFIALIAVGVVLSLALVILQTTLGDSDSSEAALQALNSDVTSLFVLILAVVGISGEWRHRTITSSLLAAPARWRFLFAKVLAYVVTAAVVSLIMTVVNVAVGSLLLSVRDQVGASFGDVVDLVWRSVVIAAFYGGIGVGIGGVIRNQPVAIVTLLIMFMLVEPLLAGLVISVGKFGPLAALPVSFSGMTEGFPNGEDLLSPGMALIVLAAWIALLVGAAGLLLGKRDVDAS